MELAKYKACICEGAAEEAISEDIECKERGIYFGGFVEVEFILICICGYILERVGMTIQLSFYFIRNYVY